MKKALVLGSMLAVIVMSSCRGERNYYHNRNGHIRHARAVIYPPWYTQGERGYDKRSRRSLWLWDRNMHK